MKSIKRIFLLACLCLSSTAVALADDVVSSPDGAIRVTMGVKKGKPFYRIDRADRHIVSTSYFGFSLDVGDLSENFKVVKKQRTSKDETWEQPWGEQRLVRNNYNELLLSLQQTKGAKRLLNLRIRVYNDGVGYRYEFPKQPNLSDFKIMDELSQVAMSSDFEAWTLPTNGTHYFEGLWTKAPLSRKDTVCTPITVAADSLYMVLHEANLTDYASLNYTPRQLNNGAAVTLIPALTPWSNGVKVYAKAPSVTPWRTFVISTTPGGLITSRLMLNLNEPCRIKDTSWITTGKYVGIWWAIHMGDYTWKQGPTHGATTENTRRYIDFAAKHGMKAVLVEGWNWGWDGDWTRDGDKFSFTKPYPDYDLEGLQRYALSKGVSLVAHNETGGAAKNYEEQLDSAFALYQRLGIHCIKTGYVNDLMDAKEHQHSQYGVRHYQKVVETAAKYQIMVINHEPAMPSGLCRTYPNLVSGEGMRGQEYNAWSGDGGNPPYHDCILPFTRGLAGPMDFTPGIFNFRNKAVPKTHPQTTLTKQLAQYVVFYSPWQMAADDIRNYENQPAFSFIESVPTNFERTVVIDAKIGEYLATARLERGEGGRWFVGCVTDEKARDLNIPLSFLDNDKTYIAEIYTDGDDADYRTNPYSQAYTRCEVTSDTMLKVHLATSGGAVMRIIPMK